MNNSRVITCPYCSDVHARLIFAYCNHAGITAEQDCDNLIRCTGSSDALSHLWYAARAWHNITDEQRSILLGYYERMNNSCPIG